MQAQAIDKALRADIRAGTKPLKLFGARDVLDVATRFWLATTVDGLRPDEGDGLVAYFELLDRRGTVYEFGVNRILRAPEDSAGEWRAWAPAWKLRLSVGFKPTLEVFQLKPAVATFACWRKDAAREFVGDVANSPPFKLVEQYHQHVSSVNLSECSSPSGVAAHPTQGFSWAIA